MSASDHVAGRTCRGRPVGSGISRTDRAQGIPVYVFPVQSPVWSGSRNRAGSGRSWPGDRPVRYLVDTCVLSERLRKNPEPKVVRWMDERDPMTHLSVLTLGELQKGVSKLPDGERKEQIQAWSDRNLLDRFEGRILPVDAEVSSTWGRITGTPKAGGESCLSSTAWSRRRPFPAT